MAADEFGRPVDASWVKLKPVVRTLRRTNDNMANVLHFFVARRRVAAPVFGVLWFRSQVLRFVEGSEVESSTVWERNFILSRSKE